MEKHTALALIFALMFLCMAIALPAPARGSVTSLELVPGKYTGTGTYVPGEVMSIIITGDTADQRFSVYSVIGEEQIIPGGNIIIPTGGSVKVSYTVPDVPDGDYLIRVKQPNNATEMEAPFSVQGYAFKIETDRTAYLSSDHIKIFWTANNLKDQTLPASGIGKIQVWAQDSSDPSSLRRILVPHLFNSSAGSVSFKLPATVTYTDDFFVDGWFNSTAVLPLRCQYNFTKFDIKRLGVLVSTDKDQYTAGSLLSLTVRTLVTDNQENPSLLEPGEPECDVTISIRKVGNIDPTYKPITLRTDSQGMLKHMVALSNDSYTDGSVFDLEIYAYKGDNSDSDSQSFEIVSSSSISIVLAFNREQYASGETLFANVTASAIGDFTSTTFTYILEIRAMTSSGSLFARDTQMNGDFSFSIPDNFEGMLWLMMTVDDGAGNSASVVEQVNVAYALMIVNAEMDSFNPNDLVTVSYAVVGDMGETPNIFYAVYDSEGKVVDEGVTNQGEFSFTVPGAPSSYYEFSVFASSGGRVVQGSDRAYLFSGYLLTLDFNRGYYGPGDIIAVDYSLVVLGNAIVPPTFNISYGLVNGPQSNLQTAQTGGTLLYVIPEDIDQGSQMFIATCDFGSTQASASEMLLVDAGANPFWHLEISDIPVFSIGVLLFALLALYMSISTRRKLRKLEKDGPSKAPAEPRKAQDGAAHSVECVECGSQIEITTTRRPIEVMCPHCGEIQHIGDGPR